MPISRSRRRRAEPSQSPELPARSNLIRPLIPVVVLAVLTVFVIALPASLIKQVLPPSVTAEDFSGTLWHGSAGTIGLSGRGAGALEWHLHPASLLLLRVSADLHWVDVGFVADATADMDRHGLTARDLRGGGPIEDLSSLGIAAGWRGTTTFKLDEVKLAFGDGGSGAGGGAQLLSARGDVEVAELSSATIANGADLGGYALHVTDVAELRDTGGPLELEATVHFSPKDRTGMLSGTVKARAAAPPAVRSQIDSLAQMHAPDAAGRIPIELEFNF